MKSVNGNCKMTTADMYGPLAIFDMRIQGFPKCIANHQLVAYLNPENLLITFNCVFIAYPIRGTDIGTKYNIILLGIRFIHLVLIWL